MGRTLFTTAWIANTCPESPGYYAILLCWDPEEGFFPDAYYWDGMTWSGKSPIGLRSRSFFLSEDEALDWARDNDPEM